MSVPRVAEFPLRPPAVGTIPVARIGAPNIPVVVSPFVPVVVPDVPIVLPNTTPLPPAKRTYQVFVPPVPVVAVAEVGAPKSAPVRKYPKPVVAVPVVVSPAIREPRVVPKTMWAVRPPEQAPRQQIVVGKPISQTIGNRVSIGVGVPVAREKIPVVGK